MVCFGAVVICDRTIPGAPLRSGTVSEAADERAGGLLRPHLAGSQQRQAEGRPAEHAAAAAAPADRRHRQPRRQARYVAGVGGASQYLPPSYWALGYQHQFSLSVWVGGGIQEPVAFHLNLTNLK